MSGNYESTGLPLWFVTAMAFAGLVFFMTHLIWMVMKIRYAQSRDKRIEYTGILVPGLSGLVIASTPWLVTAGFTPVFQLILLGLTALNLIIGRIIYESLLIRLGILKN